MTREEILEFVRRNPTSHMATIENGQPRVRAMETPLIGEDGLTFLTGSHKDVCRQLLADPAVELCYFSGEEGMQLRIRGELKPLDDLQVKKRIVEEVFTFLKPVVEKHGWDTMAIFRISSGETRIWSAADPAGGTEVFTF